jgi:preprotein translocase subunit SecA
VRVELGEIRGLDMDGVRVKILDPVEKLYKSREEFEDPQLMVNMERFIITRAIDRNWQDHLTEIEDLRRYVGLRGYAQKNPLNEYKGEAYTYFKNMMGRIRGDVCSGLFRAATSQDALNDLLGLIQRQQWQAETSGPEDAPASLVEEIRGGEEAAQEETRAQAEEEARPAPGITFRREYPKIGRNALVRLRRGDEVLDLKWKKAESLLRGGEGWELEEILSRAE